MPIDLSTATPLSNASIQYTYPEMDIRNIQVLSNTNTSRKFFFRNGMSSSSFAFTDSENSIFKSGIASEGTISVGIHDKNAYELTIKHISSSGSDFFFVVFPIVSGDKPSFIDEIVEAKLPNNKDINTINMDVTNKSLNTMITKSDIYKYDNDTGKTVFVFKDPIKTDNDLKSIQNPHGYWTDGSKTGGYTIQKIPLSDNEKITEEIVCDSTGETVEEQKADDSILIREASKIGYLSLFFIFFAGWIAYFYGASFIKDNLMNPANWKTWKGFLPIVINIILIIIVFGSVYGSNKKLSMYTSPEAILIFISLIWPLDVVFRSIMYLLLNLINGFSQFNNDLIAGGSYINFICSYLNNDLPPYGPIKNTFATYSLYALFIIWLISVFAIMTK